jgi:membrane protein YqaA with SNARE-associated domain
MVRGASPSCRDGGCHNAAVEYAALFAWSFLAATIVPLGSEPALALLARRDASPLFAILIATAGNYLGACTTYYLARKAAEVAAARSPSPRYARAVALVNRYGPPALLLSWVPLLGDIIVGVAGAARMHFGHFSVWTIVGKAARYAVVAMVARQFL